MGNIGLLWTSKHGVGRPATPFHQAFVFIRREILRAPLHVVNPSARLLNLRGELGHTQLCCPPQRREPLPKDLSYCLHPCSLTENTLPGTALEVAQNCH